MTGTRKETCLGEIKLPHNTQQIAGRTVLRDRYDEESVRDIQYKCRMETLGMSIARLSVPKIFCEKHLKMDKTDRQNKIASKKQYLT